MEGKSFGSPERIGSSISFKNIEVFEARNCFVGVTNLEDGTNRHLSFRVKWTSMSGI